MRQFAKVLTGLILAGSTFYVQAVRAEQAVISLPQTTDSADIPVLGRAIPATDLDRQSGGKDLSLTLGDVTILNNDLAQNVNASSNSIKGVTNTGSNFVTDNAFQNATGIANLIQNTGNQVVIQNSMNLNVMTR